MQQKVKEFAKHPLISGSAVIFAGSFVANIVNYIFNLAMGRLLTVEEYGLLLSLSSVFILLGVFSSSYINIFTKFSAQYFAKDDKEGIRSLYKTGLPFIFISAGILLIVLLLFSSVISSFLHISENILTIFISFAVFFSFISAMPNGILQGKMRFLTLSALNILATLLKLLSAVILILVGFHVFGAVGGIVIGSMIVPLVGFFLIYRYLPSSNKKYEDLTEEFKKNFIKYSLTTFLATIGLTLLSNTDIILVRHFMSAETSGHYAALSLMGKAIFYFTSPINFVFFPLIAQKKEKMERLFHTVLLTVGLIMIASIGLSFIYFVFPNLVLKIFFPSPEYHVLAGYLGIYSLYILMFSLMSIFYNFFLSIGRTEIYKLTIIGGIVQIALISIFHNSLFQIIGSLFFVSTLLLFFFLMYYLKYGKD
jgi:O-antigen/teichoic acid export membrane protein